MLSFQALSKIRQTLRNLNPFHPGRDMYRVNVEFDWNKHGLGAYIARQFVVVLSVLVGILMAIPTIPGPGTLTILIALLIGNYPGKRRFVAWIRAKKYFRIGRYVLRNRYRVLLVMPKQKRKAKRKKDRTEEGQPKRVNVTAPKVKEIEPQQIDALQPQKKAPKTKKRRSVWAWFQRPQTKGKPEEPGLSIDGLKVDELPVTHLSSNGLTTKEAKTNATIIEAPQVKDLGMDNWTMEDATEHPVHELLRQQNKPMKRRWRLFSRSQRGN